MGTFAVISTPTVFCSGWSISTFGESTSCGPSCAM